MSKSNESSSVSNVKYYSLKDGSETILHQWSGSILQLKFLTFLDSMGSSTWGRMGTLYYNQSSKNLSPKQIGQIEGIMPIVAAVSSPLWGMIADKLHWKKAVYVVTTIIYTFVLLMLSIDEWTNYNEGDGNRNFIVILAISIGISFFTTGSILESYTVDVCGKQADSMYGKIKLFASLGWGIGSMVIGFFTDWYGFNVNFIVYTFFTSMSLLLVVFTLPSRTKSEQKRYDAGHKIDTKILKAFLFKQETILYLLEMLVLGMGFGVVEKLLFIYLQDDLIATTSLCGLTVLAADVVEAPVFYYAKEVLNYLGESGSLLLAYAMFIFRVFCYQYLTPENVYQYIFVLEMLHGPCFAIVWSSVIEYSRVQSPPEWLSTSQSIIYLTWYSAGAGLGAFVGGWIMNDYGAHTLFRCTGYMVGVIFVRRAYLFYQECGMKNSITVNLDQCVDSASTSSSCDNSNYHIEETISEQLL